MRIPTITRSQRWRRLAVVPVFLLVAAGLQVAAMDAASACGHAGEEQCPPQSGNGGTAGSGEGDSTGTVRQNYSGGGQSCSVYANGTGMGSYCFTVNGTALKSLRERFTGQVFQQCRYRPIPEGMPAPFNAHPADGHYMLQICLQNIDFDTFSGGRGRVVKVNVVFVPNGTDTSDNTNPLNTFLWNSLLQDQQLPVPFMYTRPNVVPLVGIPTFFTFRWLDPASREVVAEGPYAGKDGGGPYKRVVTANGLVMEARATKITIDPRQKGIPPITCDPSTPYVEGAKPADQPADACKITFPRSLASAHELATHPIPDNIQDQFYGRVNVYWEVRYGTPGDMHQLGDGFLMAITQNIPVQEIQAPNQPPAVIY